MDRDESHTAEGTVIEALPSDMFRVEIDGGRRITAHVPGSVRVHIVRIVPGDRVRVAVSQYDSSRGRILARV